MGQGAQDTILSASVVCGGRPGEVFAMSSQTAPTCALTAHPKQAAHACPPPLPAPAPVQPPFPHAAPASVSTALPASEPSGKPLLPTGAQLGSTALYLALQLPVPARPASPRPRAGQPLGTPAPGAEDALHPRLMPPALP